MLDFAQVYFIVQSTRTQINIILTRLKIESLTNNDIITLIGNGLVQGSLFFNRSNYTSLPDRSINSSFLFKPSGRLIKNSNAANCCFGVLNLFIASQGHKACRSFM